MVSLESVISPGGVERNSRMSTETGTQARLRNRDVLDFAARSAERYLLDVGERRVGPSEAAVAALNGFQEAFPDAPSDPRDVVATLDELGSPASVATTGGRYFGFVNGGMVPAALAANWLAGAWNQNAALRVMSPVAAELEDVVLRWVCEALGLPQDCAGGLVTCATMANFTALATARYALLDRAGWNVVEDGMFGAPPIEVVVGADNCVRSGRKREYRSFRSRRRDLPGGKGTGRMGGRGWRLRFMGPGVAEVRTFDSGVRKS